MSLQSSLLGSFRGVVALPCIQGKVQGKADSLECAILKRASWAGFVAQLVKCLPSIQEAPGSVSSTTDTGFGGK